MSPHVGYERFLNLLLLPGFTKHLPTCIFQWPLFINTHPFYEFKVQFVWGRVYSENQIWREQGVVNDIFLNTLGNILRKCRENDENGCFDVFNHFNGIFGANLVHYPQGPIGRDLLEQFWRIKNYVSRRGDVMMTSKLDILGHFQGQHTISWLVWRHSSALACFTWYPLFWKRSSHKSHINDNSSSTLNPFNGPFADNFVS